MTGASEKAIADLVEVALQRQLAAQAQSIAAMVLSRLAPPNQPSTLLGEIRERLINVEAKTDEVIRRLQDDSVSGHPDQAFGGRTFAQYGEDLIILNIFRMLGVARPSYIDVGAHHPYNISNTALLYLLGSRGIDVEANPNLIDAFRQHRPDDTILNVGVGPARGELDFYFIDDWSGRNTFRREVAEAFVRDFPAFRISKVEKIPVVTLNDIVAEHASGRFPDLLSLDAEGMDEAILTATTFDRDRPTVICIEAETDGDANRSGKMIDLLRSRGYALYMRTVGNLLFVASDAMPVLMGTAA